MELSLVRIIVLSIVIITIVYLIYNFIIQYKTADNNAPWLIYGSKTASNSSTIVPSNKIPLSEDGKYGIEFSSIFQKDNIYGTQFHPEKSHATGFKVLINFLKYA